MKRWAAADIEALDWNRFVCAAVVMDDGEELVFYTRDGLAEWVNQFAGKVFFHYGGRYDVFFLDRPSSVALSGSGILRAQIGRAAVCDTWFLFQMSLAKIGKAVGMAKFDGKSTAIETLTLAETVEHCLNDTRILAKALHAHCAWCMARPHASPRWPSTAGGTAVYCLEAYEPDGVAHLEAQTVDLQDWLGQYQTVTGGRVELWQWGTVPGPVYAYDINSSYPQSWLDGPMPLGPWEKVRRQSKRQGVYFCTVKQSRDTFPVVAPGHVWSYDGEAWLTGEEIATVRDAGGKVTIQHGWESVVSAPFGANFVPAMYDAKLAGDPWAKVSINSAHGKLSQGVFQSNYVAIDGWHVELELSFPAWYQRPPMGAFILSRARIRLWRTLNALKAQGWQVYYVDTDCVHTNCPPEAFPGERSETKLGAWKLEAIAEQAVYVAPKVYGLQLSDGTLKKAAKGLPRDGVTWEVLAKAAQGERLKLTSQSGLVSFKGQKGAWGAARATQARTLARQTGGKVANGTKLEYPD